MALGFFSFSCGVAVLATDSRTINVKAWKSSLLNDAALSLYGRKKFSTLQKSKKVKIGAPMGIIKDRNNIPIAIDTTIKAKTLSLFQDGNAKSLIAVFNLEENSIVAYELSIRMEMKGTIFAVVESMDGKLYYARKYVDILTMGCMAS